MPNRLKRKLLRRLRLKESWAVFFIMGIVMMNYPFIAIFDKPYAIGGLPLLYIYLHLGWVVSICVIYLFVKALDISDDEGDDR